jgi:hypothetical protein
MGSSNKPTTACSDSSWQEEAARFLLSSGFRPSDTIGQVAHMSSSLREGRTLGSVWRVMRSLVDGEQERCASKTQDISCGEPL